MKSSQQELGLDWPKHPQSEDFAQELIQRNPFEAPEVNSLHDNGIITFSQEPLGQFINEQRTQNPAWQISKQDRLWERAQGRGSCPMAYQEAICHETTHGAQSCIAYLMVEVETPAKVTFDLEIYASSYAEKKTTFFFDLANGILTHQQGASSTHGWSTPPLKDYDCQRLTLTHVGYQFYHDPTIGGDFQTEDVMVDTPSTPNCANGLTTAFTLSQTHHKKNKWKNRGIKHVFRVSYQPPMVVHDRWTQHCMNEKPSPECEAIKQSVCLEGPSQKTIQGIPVARDCWKQKVSYPCPKVSNCESLREKGCEQVKRECQNEDCSQHRLTFKCPTSSCETQKEPIEAYYCDKGDCVEPPNEALGGFENAMAQLGSMIAAGKEVNSNQIFKGEALHCRKMGLAFSDCCRDKGWGQDLHLTACNEEEKLLGQAKEAKRVIAVGEYCDSKMVGECLEKKKSYCVYPSKLAKIIQQGAVNQLGRTLGEPENPLCPPLTPQDLQALDWSKIDFSELYEEIRNKTVLPSASDFSHKVAQAVNSHIKEFQ